MALVAFSTTFLHSAEDLLIEAIQDLVHIRDTVNLLAEEKLQNDVSLTAV